VIPIRIQKSDENKDSLKKHKIINQVKNDKKSEESTDESDIEVETFEIDESDIETLKKIQQFDKDEFPLQERQYFLSKEKNYKIDSQLTLPHISSNSFSIGFSLQQVIIIILILNMSNKKSIFLRTSY